jgi:hypothetical protein
MLISVRLRISIDLHHKMLFLVINHLSFPAYRTETMRLITALPLMGSFLRSQMSYFNELRMLQVRYSFCPPTGFFIRVSESPFDLRRSFLSSAPATRRPLSLVFDFGA